MTWVKIIAAILLVAITHGGAGYLGYDYGSSKRDRHWQDRELKLLEGQREVLAQREADRNRLAEQVSELDHEHQIKMAAMRRRHDSAFDKLRAAYETGCSGMSQTPEGSGVGDAAADRSRLLDRIAESLKRRIVIPADVQAQQLLECQDYVRIIGGG